MSRDAAAQLAALVETCEADPGRVPAGRVEGDSLAITLDGSPDAELAFRWRLAVIRSAIAHPPDGDAVRELYGELVDRYRDDAERLPRLRILGEEIRRLEAAGELPSSMVARSDRRSRPKL